MTWDINTNGFDHLEQYMKSIETTASRLDIKAIGAARNEIMKTRALGGRVFVLGVGGGAANSSHFVNDLRKLCGVEAYTPVDNVSELTARINDDGFEDAFVSWLLVNRLSPSDLLCVFSVGGGNREAGVSVCISNAVLYAWRIGTPIIGVVGRRDGDTVKYGTQGVVVVPVENEEFITPITEAFQAVIWHAWVSDKNSMDYSLQKYKTKW